MAKFDLEQMLAGIETIMTDNLNTKITEINTERADTITLDSVNASAFFLQTLDNTATNFNPYVFYGIQDIESEGIGPTASMLITVRVMLVVVDDASDLLIAKRMLRYLRALEETFTDNWNELENRAKIEIQQFAPIQFNEGINSSNRSRVAMVDLHLAMTGT